MEKIDTKESRNRWQKVFDEHPIKQTLEQLKKFANEEFNDADSNEYIERRRFIKVIDTFQKIVDGLDPELISVDILTSLDANLKNQEVYGQLQSYSENGNVQHLELANNNINGYLSQLYNLSAISKASKPSKPIQNLEKLVDDFTYVVTQKKDELSKELLGLKTQASECQQSNNKINEQIHQQKQQTESQITHWHRHVNEINEQIHQQKQQVESQITQWHRQFNKINEQIHQQKQQTESQITQWQQQFSTAQDERGKAYSEWREKLSENATKELNEIISNYKKSISREEASLNEEISRISRDSNQKHQEILKLYELVASDSVAGGYSKNAKEEREAANKWRLWSVGFLSLAVSMLLINKVSLHFSAPETFESTKFWINVITSLSITGILLWGAAYSAQQSTRHRNSEKRAIWFALEVTAIDPFISSLGEAQRAVLKRDLAARLFANSQNVDSEKETKIIEEHLSGSVLKIITALIGKIK